MTIPRDHIAAWLRCCADCLHPLPEEWNDDGIEISLPIAALISLRTGAAPAGLTRPVGGMEGGAP